MLWALLAIVVLLVGIITTALVLIMKAQNPSEKPNYKVEKMVKSKNRTGSKATYRHIAELIKIEMIEEGIFYTNGLYIGLAKLSGTNFDVMSVSGQNAIEDVIIAIQNQINYPVNYTTGTVIADTDKLAAEIRLKAENYANEKRAMYSHMYANVLDEMKKTRYAMTQVTWLAISDDGQLGNPVEKIKDKMSLLENAFRRRAGIVLVPLFSEGEAIDALNNIMLPERLIKPSDMLSVGGLSPVKFNIREIENIA